MEYYAYKPKYSWCIRELLKISVVCVLVAYLLYDRVYFAPLLFPVGIYIWRSDRRKYKRGVKEALRREFKEFITMLSGGLNAGYSLEQAIRRTYEDMLKDNDFCLLTRELALIINGMNLNQNVEELLMEMGRRCQEEEMINFARLVATAKSYGGNINALINKTKKNLNDKITVEGEIATMVSAKRLEGYIMLLMPFGIMLYMRLTNEAYIIGLYQSLMGNVVVTVALCTVLLCGMIIKKITEIEV